jgi:hypothetical protein
VIFLATFAIGRLLRAWAGASFIETFVQDDQHFLMIADDGPETPRGIIRCTLPKTAPTLT